MASKLCLDNIQKERPPVYCGNDYCRSVQVHIDEYCLNIQFPPNRPVPQFVEGIGICWCCCDNGAAMGMPVEVEAGAFRLSRLIECGDTVRATDAGLRGWTTRAVTACLDVGPKDVGHCSVTGFIMADGSVRRVASLADQLYLAADGGLRPAQALGSGDRVMQADGGIATVHRVERETFGRGVRSFALGDLEPSDDADHPYAGHLLNTYGLVTADLTVQLAFLQRSGMPRSIEP